MKKLAILTVLLASCSSDQTTIADGEETVRSKLIDPESAIFYDSFVSTTGAVCGLVNSRNRMGGMVGKMRFVASGTYVQFQTRGSHKNFTDYWDATCIKPGG